MARSFHSVVILPKLARLGRSRNEATEVAEVRAGVSGFHRRFHIRKIFPQVAPPPGRSSGGCSRLKTAQEPGDVWRLGWVFCQQLRINRRQQEAATNHHIQGSFSRRTRRRCAEGPGGEEPLPSSSSGSYLRTFPLFLPPPQPPLHSTGLSRKEMRSLPDGPDVVCLGDGRFSPE